MNKLLKKVGIICATFVLMAPITTFALSCNWREVKRGSPVTTAYGKVQASNIGFSYYTDYTIRSGSPVGIMAEVRVEDAVSGDYWGASGVKANGNEKTVSVGRQLPAQHWANHYWDHHTNMAK